VKYKNKKRNRVYINYGVGFEAGVLRLIFVVGVSLLHLLSWILTSRESSKSLPQFRQAACCLVTALPLFLSAMSRLRLAASLIFLANGL
jgi:hypothetical protein